MNLMKIARVPPVVVDCSASVLDSIRAMVDGNVGAVAVVAEGKLRGIFSERDVIRKVIYHNLPPESTPVAEVMIKEVEAARQDMHPSVALRLMARLQVRHLPIINQEGEVLGILSVRQLLQSLMEQSG